MREQEDPLRYFRIEAGEIADELGRCALHLESGTSPDTVARLLRLAHTLKGAAGVVRQPIIAEHAHALEDELVPFRDHTGPFARREIDAVIAHVDAITALVTEMNRPPNRLQRAAVEDPALVIRAETAEMDVLLDSITEVGVQMRGLRTAGDLALRVRRLSERLVERAAVLSVSIAASGVSAIAGELRATAAMLEQTLASGLDFAEREMLQARTTAEHLRLLPCSIMLTGLERAARDIARSSGKQIQFEARGGDVRLDAQVLPLVQRALVQMVRNAVAHGIEASQVRAQAGKDAAGRVELEISRRGNRVSFVCRDDGGGVDLNAVRQAARARGVPSTFVAKADADELLQMLFRGGLSTAETVTELSGRGVGLDIVREMAAQLGGQVDVSSEAGRGTRIEIVVPVSLASIDALLVESGGAVRAIPLTIVCNTLRLVAADILRTADGLFIKRDGTMVPFSFLSRLVGESENTSVAAGAAVVIGSSARSLALGVDRVLGVENIIVRPLPAMAFADPLVSGFSLDVEGVPRLLLDGDGLIEAAARRSNAESTPDAAPAPQAPILVIDDSLTTRRLEQSILESAGYEVDLATSGEEGLQKAQGRRYGLFLVDVEMPGMGGFAFVEAIRADSSLRSIPAILVTSRDASEDRDRGRRVGANAYVIKGEFDQNQVLSTIRNLLVTA